MGIDSIIAKALAGKASSEELALLKAWRADSAANVAVMKDLHTIAEASDHLQGYQSYDADEAWESMAHRVDEPQTSKLWIWAALLLLVAVSIYYMQAGRSAVPQQEVILAAGSVVDKVMEDGSRILVDAGSSVTIPADWSEHRKVYLIGRAFFDVEKQPSAQRFTIDLDQGRVEVVGTAFSIWSEGKKVEIGVEEGHVIYYLDNRKVDLFAGDKLELIDGTVAKTSGLSENYYSWKNGKLTLKDEIVTNAITELASFGNATIEIAEGVDLSMCRISGEYTQASVEDVLDEWRLLTGLRYKYIDGVYIISSIDCNG